MMEIGRSLSLHFPDTTELVMQMKSPRLCVQVLEVQALAFSYVAAVGLRQQCSWHPTKVHRKVVICLRRLWFGLHLHEQQAGPVQDIPISIKKITAY